MVVVVTVPAVEARERAAEARERAAAARAGAARAGAARAAAAMIAAETRVAAAMRTAETRAVVATAVGRRPTCRSWPPWVCGPARARVASKSAHLVAAVALLVIF